MQSIYHLPFKHLNQSKVLQDF